MQSRYSYLQEQTTQTKVACYIQHMWHALTFEEEIVQEQLGI